MKSGVIAAVLVAGGSVSGLVTPAVAQDCFEVSGTVNTVNVATAIQTGDIELTLSNAQGVEFSRSGSIVGTITGADSYGAISLSHTISFPLLDSFVTQNDEAAYVTPFVRKTKADGTACSYFIHETSTQILLATGYFSRVTAYDLNADGYVSDCPDENGNYFELSGTICLD